MMVEDLPALNPWKRRLADGREKIFVLLDGMRWDLWEFAKESFFKPLAGFSGTFRIFLDIGKPLKVQFFS